MSAKSVPTRPQSGIKSCFLAALIFTKSHRIPANASANQGPKEGDSVLQEVSRCGRRRGRCLLRSTCGGLLSRLLGGSGRILQEIYDGPQPGSYTLHPTPYTLHPTPLTLNPVPYTLYPTPYTLHPTPCTLHPTPYTLHPAPYALPRLLGGSGRVLQTLHDGVPNTQNCVLPLWGALFTL